VLGLVKESSNMAQSINPQKHHIDKRDFDANRPLLADYGADEEDGRPPGRSEPESRTSRLSGDGNRPSEGLLSEVVENIVERDRQRLKREMIRILSFTWSIIAWYV
jgi:hypothetical protein